MKSLILLVDDDETQRNMLQKILIREGYDVETASSGRDALEKFRTDIAEVVVTDIRMPDMNGLQLFREIKQLNQDTSVILITAYGDIKSAVQAMADGASYYLEKPVNVDQLKTLIRKTVENRASLKENSASQDGVSTQYGFDRIVGCSGKMEEVYALLKKVAESDVTVLLLGETGTGKELAARAIHNNSKRRSYPFVKVSCASLPESLLESALFGHEKGAYTGADARQIGMFERADKGTIFLDEIGEINQNVQIKLLRFLQERKFERVGGVQPIEVDARIIAATNIDLEKAIQDLKIRKDLYYRLNVVQIHLPPLRDRKEDIALLVDHFLEKYNDRSNGKVKCITPEALSTLMRHDWPGNVRELENCIERAIVMGMDDTIRPLDFPSSFHSFSPSPNLSTDGISLDQAERDLILKALQKVNGVQTKAAKILGISRRTLQGKLDKHGISAREIRIRRLED